MMRCPANGNDKETSSLVTQTTKVSLDELMEVVGHGPFQRILLLMTAATQLADAMELLLISFLTEQIHCTTEWGKQAGEMSISLISTVVFVGMLFGGIGVGRLSDTYGRRVGFLCSTVSMTHESVQVRLTNHDRRHYVEYVGCFAPLQIHLRCFSCFVFSSVWG
jgi:MFS family permease